MTNKPIILTTPEGTAKWPYLTDPDTMYDPGGLYHTKLTCKKEDSVKIKKVIDDLIAQEVKKQHDENPDKAIKKSLPYIEEGDEITFTFKMKASGTRKVDGKSFTQAPNILNNDHTPFDKSQKIWSDSILQITFEPYAWNMPIGIGCTLRIKDVQVVQLVTGKQSNTLGDLKPGPVVAPKIKNEMELV